MRGLSPHLVTDYQANEPTRDRQKKNESRGNKKRRCNNSDKNDGEKKFYCLLHSKNSTHNTNNCQTFKQQTEERNKGRGGNRNNRNNKKRATIQTK